MPWRQGMLHGCTQSLSAPFLAPMDSYLREDSTSKEILFRNLTALAVFIIMLLFLLFWCVFYFLNLSYNYLLVPMFQYIFKHVRNREPFHFVFFPLVIFCFSTFFYVIEWCLNDFCSDSVAFVQWRLLGQNRFLPEPPCLVLWHFGRRNLKNTITRILRFLRVCVSFCSHLWPFSFRIQVFHSP